MFRATWLTRKGEVLRSKDYLSLSDIEAYTFNGEKVIQLQAKPSLVPVKKASLLSALRVVFGL